MADSPANLQTSQRRLLSGPEDLPQKPHSNAESLVQPHDAFCDSTFGELGASPIALEAYRYDLLYYGRLIRVLTLHPGAKDAEIYCTLDVVQLSEPPPYEALSYAWGDSKERHPIRCGNETINVTINLYAALKRLREVSVERVLWIDAICINQEDEIEKGTQVRQMAEIYSSAIRVLIWLGEETESVPAAFEAIRWTRTLFPDGGVLTTFLAMSPEEVQMYSQRHHDYAMSGEMMRIFEMWGPVLELARRPWFSRKWIVQEVIRGRDGQFVCGTHTLPWIVLEETCGYMKVLGMLVVWLSYLSDAEATFFSTIFVIGNFRSPGVKTTLPRIIRGTRRLVATVPRDQLISMVHIASDINPDDVSFLVDYRTPTTTEYLMKFMQWSVQTKKTLIYLSSGFEQADIADPTQPSWIFNVNEWDGHDSNDRSVMRFRASTESLEDSNSEITFDFTRRTMSVTGIIIDDISVLGATVAMESFNSNDLSKEERKNEARAVRRRNYSSLRKFYMECRVIATDDSNSPETPGFQGFCDVLTWESCKYLTLTHGLSLEYITSQVAEILAVVMEHVDSDSLRKMVRTQPLDHAVMLNLEGHSIGRRFSRTTKGRLGSMPKYAEVGDKICIFHGGKFPYVIRPRGDGTYRYIGDCYLEGVMYGEAMVEGRKSEVFTLV